MNPDADSGSGSEKCMMAQPMTRRRNVDVLPCSMHAYTLTRNATYCVMSKMSTVDRSNSS
jgi:hypothetical protein